MNGSAMRPNRDEISFRHLALFPLSAINYPSTFLTAVTLADTVSVLKAHDIMFLKDLTEPIAHDFYVKRDNPNADAFWGVNQLLVDVGVVRAFQSTIDVQGLMDIHVRPEDFPELRRDLVDHDIVPDGMSAPWYSVGFHEFFEFLEKAGIPLVLSPEERMTEEFSKLKKLNTSVVPPDVADILSTCLPVMRPKPIDKLAQALLRIRTELGSDRSLYLEFLKAAVLAMVGTEAEVASESNFDKIRRSVEVVNTFKAAYRGACAAADCEATFMPIQDSIVVGESQFGSVHLVLPAESVPGIWAKCHAQG
jgi:hypothetical protein